MRISIRGRSFLLLVAAVVLGTPSISIHLSLGFAQAAGSGTSSSSYYQSEAFGIDPGQRRMAQIGNDGSLRTGGNNNGLLNSSSSL